MLGQILMGVGVAVGGALLALVKPLFSWLKGKANEQKLLARTQIDDVILDALETGVSNVANSLRQQMASHKAGEPLTAEEKVALREAAIHDAQAILRAKGVELFKVASEEAVNALIRHLVDKATGK